MMAFALHINAISIYFSILYFKGSQIDIAKYCLKSNFI